MKENKITQDFLSTAYDVLSGKTSVVPTFQEQADEVLFEMWLNDEIQLEDTQYEELIDLYKQFENNEISEKQLEEGIGRVLRIGAKKAGSLAKKGAKKAGSLAAKGAKAGAKKAGSLAAKGVKAGAKKVAKRLSTQGRIDAAKKKLGKIKKKKELKQVKKDIKTAKSS
tara:strand:+ start:236 stop:739 length:504 start_codon:yes stop_codon:yes gene_type:complete